MTATNDTYIFTNSWERERARLVGLSAQFDRITIRHLTALGVAPGWHCLELGAGAGSIARWLADTVGPTGRVLATDLDIRFLTDLPARVEVRQHNLVEDPLPGDAYDLIHARAVLEHIATRRQVIAGLVAALKPGGLLVLEDVVLGAPFAGVAQRVVRPASAGPLHARTLDAVAAGMRSIGADPVFGLDLPDALEAAGLHDVDAELAARFLRGGSPESAFSDLSLRELGDRLVAAGLLTTDEVTEALEVNADPTSRWLSLGLVTAWGRRPRQ